MKRTLSVSSAGEIDFRRWITIDTSRIALNIAKACLAGEMVKDKKAEASLRIELNDEAWERLYGYMSHPIPPKGAARQVAIRVVSQFGEESTKLLEIE